jgi:hypothetical protein
MNKYAVVLAVAFLAGAVIGGSAAALACAKKLSENEA